MTKNISQDYLIGLKERFDLVKVISESANLNPVGNGEFKGKCPFHDEDSASFTVNKDRYHCFGCHVHGDLFDWVMKTSGKTFSQAVKQLAQEGPPLPQGEAQKKRTIPNHTPYDSVAIARIIQLNAKALEFYRSEVFQDDIAHNYATERFSENAWNVYDIGYAPAERSALLDYMQREGVEPQELFTAGLVAQASDGSFYDRLRDRLTIPLKNAKGDILGFVGRLIPRKGNDKLPKYVNPTTTHAFEKRRFIFGLDQFEPKLKYIIVVEGPVDAITLTDHGIKNVVSIMGCNLSRFQSDILNNLCPRVFMLLDGDRPGLEGTVKASEFSLDAKYLMFHVLLTDDLDPDTWIRKLDPPLPSPLKSLPIITSSSFLQQKIVITNMKKEYDRSLLDQLSRPYVLDNIKNGWPHYNVVDWVMAAYPEYSRAIKEATLRMIKNTVELPNGKLGLKEENVKEFIKQWVKPSREVRLKHANQFKTKGR